MTRSSLIVPSAWVVGSGRTIDGGEATHTPGTASELAQPLAAQVGRWYRIGFAVSDRTAGAVAPRLSGGSLRPGTAISVDGQVTDRIQAVTGNDTLEFSADAAFDGAVSDILLNLETAACLDAGTHYLWLEPQNADGVPGPINAPLTIEVI